MNTLLVYVHLMAACVAVGILLMQDLSLSKTAGKRLSIGAVKELKAAAHMIMMALGVLWASGLVLVIWGVVKDPEYLLNQKLWAKVAVVVVLTVNGAVLHRFSFPRVVSSTGMIGLGILEKTAVVMTGAVSTVSWLFACYLGIARPWNHAVEFDYVMFIYASLLLPACVFACLYIHAFAARAAGRRRLPSSRAALGSLPSQGLRKGPSH